MTRYGAAQALKEGKKLTHNYFSPDEWVMGLEYGYYIMEDGVKGVSDQGNICPISSGQRKD